MAHTVGGQGEMEEKQLWQEDTAVGGREEDWLWKDGDDGGGRQ